MIILYLYDFITAIYSSGPSGSNSDETFNAGPSYNRNYNDIKESKHLYSLLFDYFADFEFLDNAYNLSDI